MLNTRQLLRHAAKVQCAVEGHDWKPVVIATSSNARKSNIGGGSSTLIPCRRCGVMDTVDSIYGNGRT